MLYYDVKLRFTKEETDVRNYCALPDILRYIRSKLLISRKEAEVLILSVSMIRFHPKSKKAH